jgi:hypothetical protein
MLKRLLAALAVLTLLTGFVAACGGDDDDSSSSQADSSGDDTAAPDSSESVDPAMATVCSDTGQADDGVITPDEAGQGAEQLEAVTDPPPEIADAITGAAQYFRQLQEAGEDVQAEDLAGSEHLTAIGEWCSANMSDDGTGGGGADEGS